MSEESILILNMLREGKVSAEQADSLLRAVRETAPSPSAPSAGPQAPVPPVAPSAPPPPPPDPSVLHGKLGDKLGDLQAKLGDLQGKLAAAAASKVAESAVAMAGKAFDKIPRPEIEINVNKIIDEAMRGLHSVKGEAMRTAREAARQARDEVRKAGREGRRAVKWDFKFDFEFPEGGSSSGRPDNTEDLPEATEDVETTHNWTGAGGVKLVNPCGNIIVRVGDTDENTARVTLKKRAWAATDAEARVLLPQLFLTAGVENEKWTARVVAPADARSRLTADMEIVVPAGVLVEAETTHGDIHAEGIAASSQLQSASGKIIARALPPGESDGRFVSRSGDIELDGWDNSENGLAIETQSGDVRAEAVTAKTVRVVSRSGEVTLGRIVAAQSATLETASGDLRLEGGTATEKLTVKTQSGGAAVSDFQSAQLQMETVSGDLSLRGTSGVLSIKTVSGDMEADAITSAAVSLGTVSGDARFAFAAPFSGSLAGTTVSGDLTVALWTNSDTRIELSTLNGDLACGLSLEDKSPDSEKHLSGKLGDGTGSVKLQSVSGDLRVEAQP